MRVQIELECKLTLKGNVEFVEKFSQKRKRADIVSRENMNLHFKERKKLKIRKMNNICTSSKFTKPINTKIFDYLLSTPIINLTNFVGSLRISDYNNKIRTP